LFSIFTILICILRPPSLSATWRCTMPWWQGAQMTWTNMVWFL
jgi:hypothetical protein